MQTPFNTWLQSLGPRRADMRADRGLPMSHTIQYPGNVTSWGLAGTVKSSPDSVTELAVFTIGTPSFDAGSNLTTWAVSLSAAQTAALPADADLDGRVDLVFDFLISGPGGTNPPPFRLFGGIFSVSGFVTELA